MPGTFYRIIRNDAPSRLDFLPAAALRKPPPKDPRLRPLWETGISVYATEQQARKKAKSWEPDYPLGMYLARLEISDDAQITIEKTLGAGHYTLQGEPELLMACVTEVTPVVLPDTVR